MKPFYILGISAFYHDSAAALIKDGQIIAAAQEERFTRKKHDSSFPQHAICYCLNEAKIEAGDLGYVVFYEKPFLKFERILSTYLAYAPFGLRSFLKAMPVWLKDKIFLKDIIKRSVGFKGELLFTEHHASHAAAAFFPSPFKEAAILTMDGVGEWGTVSFGEGKDNFIKLSSELKFPHSLGLLYSAFTYYCGFKVNSGEYKLMGLAPYGEPKYVDLIKDKLIDIKGDGSFKLNMAYFDYCSGLKMTNKLFNRLFAGPPRRPESEIPGRILDIACSIQKVTEEVMLKLACYVYSQTKKKNLCLSGGVALNCVGNGVIQRDGPFERVWIQPAAGDAGSALGAALFVWYQYMKKERLADDVRDFQRASLLGSEYSDEDILKILTFRGAVFEKLQAGDVAKRAALLIAQGKIVGWFQGRMEFGPRALGARSILADARVADMQSQLNKKVKFRESFRPFAPSVLEEHCSEYFDLSCPSPYMLFTGFVKDGVGLPAVTHVDYSARLQTVARRDNSLFYDVIKEFYNLTGCPVIINTSFNVRGEPIVSSPEEALGCFLKSGMDVLFIGPYLLDKQRQKFGRQDFGSVKCAQVVRD